MTEGARRTVLWWGRFDPDYSRNRILRQAFTSLGWDIIDFKPTVSPLAKWQAMLSAVKTPDLVWVPSFRQRDMIAASNWARKRHVPLIFDPLISAYDKQVFERRKFESRSSAARQLLDWEKERLARADFLIADTHGHADYFSRTFGLSKDKIQVIPVGAEESLFVPAPMPLKSSSERVELLFYGSFIGLQAPDIIVSAAKLCQDNVHWTLLGDGPERQKCEQLAEGHPAISFEDYLPYAELPSRIANADILLGIFGVSEKAARVIPNKVYQAMACGRPVLTRESTAYPPQSSGEPRGLIEIEAGNPAALASTVEGLMNSPGSLPESGIAARNYYERYFGTETVRETLESLLAHLRPYAHMLSGGERASAGVKL